MRSHDRLLRGWIIFGLGANASGVLAQGPVFCDFNGDGYSDLATGSADEDDNGGGDKFLVGAVNVIYGGPLGLTAADNQYWHQDTPGMRGVCDDGERFGRAIASGDFNGDGFADLVAGAPGDALQEAPHVAGGCVSIIYGSALGLMATGNQLVHQDSPGIEGETEEGDRFGEAVAVGDFDGDGFDDILVGIPGESARVQECGAVEVLYGSPEGVGRRSVLAYQAHHGVGERRESWDEFGAVVAAGDFNGDGFDDAVVGAPGEDSHLQAATGFVTIVYGSPAGLRLKGFQQGDQDSFGVPGDAKFSSGSGMCFATGDFNGDDRDDLAIGMPEALRLSGHGRGLLLIFAGTPTGLRGDVNQAWEAETAYTGSYPGVLSPFATALCAADFDGNGKDDLAIGMGEAAAAPNYFNYSGVILVMRGAGQGLTSEASEVWTQDSPGIPENNEVEDFWGSDVGAADFNGDGFMDLVIGARSESVETAVNAGAATVLYGGVSGFVLEKAQLWHQGIEGVIGVPSSSRNILYRGFGDALCKP